MSNNRFFSQDYIDDYNSKGVFPKIHDDIVTLISNFSRETRALDLGACTFLLPVRLIEKLDFDICIGIEGNKNYVDRAVSNEKVLKESFYVNADTLENLRSLIVDNNIKLITARRVLPEISNNDIDIIHELAKTLYESGIEEIALEGRVKTKNATALLSSIEDEVKAMSKYYSVYKSYKNCRLLRKNV